MKPRRRDDLILRELDDEAVVYDFVTQKAHCLNRAALAVFRLCDGKRGVPALARATATELGASADDHAEELVWLALAELDRARLLEDPLPRRVDVARRALLKKMALTAGLSIALPAVWSILAPTPAYAATTACIMAQICVPGSHACCGTPGQQAMACDGNGMCNASATQCMGLICS
jgi:hypothetical protein